MMNRLGVTVVALCLCLIGACARKTVDGTSQEARQGPRSTESPPREASPVETGAPDAMATHGAGPMAAAPASGAAAPGPGAPLTVPAQFDRFFALFLSLYQARNPQMQQLVRADLGYYTMEAAGAPCVGEQRKPSELPWCSDEARQGQCYELKVKASLPLKAGSPKGSCEGYPGVQEAIYYAPVNAKDLPSFHTDEDLAAGKNAPRLALPAKYRTAPLMRVQTFAHSQLQYSVYFIQIEGRWYLLAQDLCIPCGA